MRSRYWSIHSSILILKRVHLEEKINVERDTTHVRILATERKTNVKTNNNRFVQMRLTLITKELERAEKGPVCRLLWKLIFLLCFSKQTLMNFRCAKKTCKMKSRCKSTVCFQCLFTSLDASKSIWSTTYLFGTNTGCSRPSLLYKSDQEIALVFSRCCQPADCRCADCRELGVREASIDSVWLLTRWLELVPTFLP